MAEFIIGKDIFNVPGDLYLITVNVVGVMGAGLAKSFKEKYPELFERYKHDCKKRIITIGNPVIYKASDGKRFMMFPTKDNWRNPSQISFIERGLEWMMENVSDSAENEEDCIHPDWKIIIPPLGCANGGLDFSDVRTIIEDWSNHMPNQIVVVYPPWIDSSV
ncbi:hypothetical protein KEN51_CDS0305 [Pseudomonas phage vB_Pae10145-KEN51]|uniref:PHIKZ104 n=4 Tax=Viruses TaxID=10239 RepID=Q8SD58_BPDPK|nr:macro domain-containing protein [Pseudomonas phage phiKZ]YP_009617563.1 macro domain-containing protein [Pseudomonas phage PA7]MBG7006424.1 macro domain-containing protein [Pseudomonas aeruginosa]QJB22767.1 hypothetical protein fnug_124 [Pseudomonas phage fnug]QOV07979.1 hypothetical protein [Pseudomonas phage vB_PaeM_kmuB]UNI71735.1 macrodomains-containing protein [Pseudomonas phage Churi01]UXD83566.1 phosphatase [Pseudomonas phage Koomba boorn-mokiny kep-wari Wadjak 2]WAX23653.1 ADP-rib